ncbi:MULTISPECIES: TIGR03943 family putative permease subunit [Streptomyces]|uniref:Membrane protein n=1 Tax=Streptomyces rubiginosohelvolus TaxID=67362 RepID=A0ABQ3BHN7_9ACTN|nr:MULTISPECIES: TIGR03943 family protein [Streptomyces]WST55048.1 TIGR03943 family protein [Streptomyces rubiginosohelvolus]GGR76611.1 membrane protein [Streptomyces rubiginosohelvolus]GGZ40373.1 membrane protein [Streptomyces pluricolorescens]
MKRLTQAILLVLSGTGLLHIALLTDLYLRYVKEWMRPMLIASGVLLLLLGAAEVWSHRRPGAARARDRGEQGTYEDPDGHPHDHSGVPRAAWLLLLPALSMLLYAPPALGAYTASRQTSQPVAVQQDHFEPLPEVSPLPLTLGDFATRVRQDPEQAVKGRSIQMTGFVTPVERGEGWDLTRLLINCCSADAQAVKVRIHGGETPPADTWVTVVGTWRPDGMLGTSSAAVALDARTVRTIDRPADWYRDALVLPLAD